jgi:hypothetical protein
LENEAEEPIVSEEVARRLDAYLGELKFNNRENPYMFRNAMLKLSAKTLPYEKLIED